MKIVSHKQLNPLYVYTQFIHKFDNGTISFKTWNNRYQCTITVTNVQLPLPMCYDRYQCTINDTNVE